MNINKGIDDKGYKNILRECNILRIDGSNITIDILKPIVKNITSDPYVIERAIYDYYELCNGYKHYNMTHSNRTVELHRISPVSLNDYIS